VAVGRGELQFTGRFRLMPVPHSGPWLRFHTPLVEPAVRFSRNRLSFKTSRFRPREARRPRLELNKPQALVQVSGREA